MINFTNLISKVSKVSKVSQQNCESRMGTCLALAKHSPRTYLPLDSVSIVSRQSDLAKYVATLAVLLCLSIGQMWGADVHYILVSKGYAPLTKKTLDASYNVLKTDGSSIGKVTSISSSITSEASLYYNSTSPTYSNLTKTSNYGTSSGDNNTLRGINIGSGKTATINLGSQTFTKIDVIYRCNSSSSGTLTIAGEDVATSSTSVGLKTKTGSFSSSFTIKATSQDYRVVVILTREYSPSYTVTYDANGGSGTAPSDANTYEADDPVTVLGKNTLSKSGYIFAGWNTAANGSGTPYSPGETMNTGAGNVTLHAQWDTEVDLKYVWKTGNKFCDDNSTSTTTVNMISENDYFTLTGTGVSQESGSSLNIGKAVGNYFLITAKSGYQISSICFNGKIESTNVNKTTDNSDWSGTIASTGTGSDKRYTFDDINSTYFGVKLNTADKGIYIRNMVITIASVAPSCTAPNHVDVSGRWDRFGGETISLTATAYSSAGTGSPIADANITGWQWQKLIGSTWTDVTDGTVGGVTTSGATTKNLQIANCGRGNSGKYRCVVSTGATCSTASATATDGSQGHQVKVFVLECYTGGTTEYNFTRTGDTQSGTCQITLAANTAYTFKMHVDNTYYGNNGTINTDATNWVMCNSDNGGSCATNLTVNSGLGGTFTFGVEYSTGGNSSVEGEPEISVTYPRKTIYLAPNSDWLSNSAKFAYYYFHKTGDDTDAEGWTGFLTADDCGRHADIPQWNGVKVIAVRFNSSKTSTGNWDDKWNQTDDITVTSNDLITITGWNNSQTYTAYSPSTYTITFAGNDNASGSMTNVSSIPCGEDRTLADNAFVKTDNIFDGWKANVDVTIGGANVTAGTLISDGATLQNIHSNITLTAQWTHCTGPSITAEAGMAGQTYSVGDAATTMTVTAAAGNGGTLHYHWYQYNVGQDPLTQSIDAVGGTDANTYTPSTASAHEGQIFYCVVSEEECSTTVKSAYSGAITVNAPATPIITYNIKVTGSGTTIKGSDPTTTDGTNISTLNIVETNAGASGDPTGSNRSTKIAIKTGANGADWSGDPTNYVLFKFKVACGKKLTPSKIHIPVANVGSASANNIKYKAVMSDYFGHTLTGTYVVTTGDGTVENFDINNADASKYFQGEITLKLWAWTIASKDNGGSAFRMGTPVTIYGEIANQATSSATITWDTHPANGTVGDDDVTIAAHASDGSTITYTSNNVAVATIVEGKVHYVGAGTTTIQASITDQCGNTVNQNSNSFTVSAGSYTGLSVTKDPSAGSATAPTISATSVTQGSGVTVTAYTAASGYMFIGWESENGTFADATSLSTTFTPSANNAVAVARYAEVKTITLKVLNNGNVTGWVIQGCVTYPSAQPSSITVDGVWTVMTFTDVYAVSNIDLAYAGGDWDYLNSSTKITDDACYEWDGTPRSCDITAPTLVSSDPADGDTDEAISGTIVLTFSEEIASVDGSKFTLTGATKGAVTIDGSDATKVNIAYSGAANESTVTLSTAAAAVSDAAGNTSAALSDISFTTLASSGCETIVEVVANSATTVSSIVGSGTVNSPSSQSYTGAIKLNSSGYIQLTPKAGSSFAAGNKLTITMYTGADSGSKTIGFRLANKDDGNSMSASVAAKEEKTFEYTLVAADITDGKIKIYRYGSESWFVSAIVEACGLLPDCTTPTLPTLSNKTVCARGTAESAWDASITNGGSLADGETVSYKWTKKGSDVAVSSVATYTPTSVTESMAGTYVVTATVSAAGKASKSASAEVDLVVTPATETPSVSASKAKVYQGDEVTLTATCGSTGITWEWYQCSDAVGTITGSKLSSTNSYTISSAPTAGTYYYKAVAKGDGTNSCGDAEYVYTLTVSAADACDKEFWFAKEGDRPDGAASATHISGTPSGSSSASYTASIDGTNYTITGCTGQKTGNVTIVVPADNTGTLYVVVAGSSSRTITLNKGETQIGQETPDNSTWGVFSFADLDAGTYTLVSSGNISWGIIALKLCPTIACSDDTPTATATNETVCSGGTITITATGYEDGATLQWQKQNASTSAWENISGATTATYTVASAAVEHAGKYQVVATKTCARTSNTVTIAVPSAPVFGDVPASVSIMETLALSISTVEATDAVKYKWYKSADATWDAGDAEIGTEKNLIKAYDGETAGSTYYIFCRAQNACGITTSSAIAINVTAYVEEDCATRGNEGETEFGFDYGSAGQGSYSSAACWTMNSNSKFLTYTAPEGKYFKTAKVTIASSSESRASYNWSTDGGSSYTAVALTVNSTLTERTIDLSAHGNVNSLQIGRNFNSTGSSGGTLYVSKICFEYTEACTSTTVTPSTSSVAYEMGGAWSNPTFTLTAAAVAAGGTLTYSSSNEDIASVDDDGTVTFNGDAGVVRITASYAGDGTYCASEGYYTITVSCSAGTPSIAASGSTNLSDCNASVTLTASGVTSGGTYQWFRGGEEVDGATNASITVKQAGTYTVEYTKDGCTALSSNSIAVTSEATQPEVERLVPFQYYHVDKTYTDQMKMRHLFAVKNSGKLDGKSFKLYVSRNGGAATDVTNSNALAIWTNADGHVDTVMIDLNKLSGKYSENDELVYTCKAIDCEGDVSNVYKATIQMHVIGATPTLALICSGSDKEGGTRKTGELTVGGDFLTGYNKADLCEQTGNTSFDASTEWGLYTRLKANYIVTPVNGYANFYKLNYEPFDILLLTDYPKASKSDAAATVLDDMADLCDYRPLLSLKAHMVAKSPSKWAAKGFTTTPVVPKNTRTRLNIVCYAHPMFSTLKEKTDYVQEDYDDQSQIVYTMLKEGGYETKDGVKKGMQGFEIDAAENFVTIGLIHYNATAADETPSDGYVTWTSGSGDRMLVAAAERQANPEARMILFAVNCGAQSKFTETGRTVIHKCLEYLLTDHTITPMADCSFTFDNGTGNSYDQATYKSKCPECTGTIGDGLWSTAGNWGPDYVLRPSKGTEVKIAAPVEVDMDHAVARSARIVEGGKIIIPAGKALEIVGTIRRMDGSELSPTQNNDIFIGSTAAGNGTLIFNNSTGDSKATVAMYTTALADVANMSAATSTWQYIGTPHNDVAIATYNYYDSWLYQYDTEKQGWVVIPNGGPLVPFRGYCVTHPEANHTFIMGGKLTATTSADIEVPANKFVVAANSWVAPIDITKITDDDMDGISDKTIYFFNTGSDSKGENGTGTAPGTYVAVPKDAASYLGNWQIPSMQGFYIGSTTAGTLHLDYDRHVRPTGDRGVVSPMYAPQRFAEDNEPEVAKLYFRGSRYYDRLVVLEREDFTRGYDSGWDGEAWGGNSASPLSCVSGEGRWDAVSAIPEFEGTVVGFQAGEDNAYTIDFEYSEEYAPLYLYDTEAKTYSRVLTGNAYYFTTSDKDYHDRFFFTRNAPSVITGIEPTSDSSVEGRAKKLLIEDKLFILLNGVLYDATGKVVK